MLVQSHLDGSHLKEMSKMFLTEIHRLIDAEAKKDLVIDEDLLLQLILGIQSQCPTLEYLYCPLFCTLNKITVDLLYGSFSLDPLYLCSSW